MMLCVKKKKLNFYRYYWLYMYLKKKLSNQKFNTVMFFLLNLLTPDNTINFPKELSNLP